MNEFLFSYGTLQQEKTQVELFGRKLQGTIDELKGYKVVAIEIKDEMFLLRGEEKFQKTLVNTKNENDSVKGMIFEITEGELFFCDKYEPVNYKRIKAMLQSGREAWIYLAISS
ncbi:MAG: gamma-glutamylcyclotransferase [Bacteroidetes bacterium]|nr:gamma-glutamylcyclotransferase [Bacteroidota bacterium]MBS1930201.1 gamma-glutamylcyclotransferase [Bacteroidota bacterium]